MGFVKDPRSEKLYAVDVEDGNGFWPTTKNVAVEFDFHRIDAPGQPIDAVEKMLAEIDGEFATALKRIIEARSFDNPEDRATVFMCMSLMFVKNPAMRESTDEAANAMANLTMQLQAADPEQWKNHMKRAIAEGTIPVDADIDKLREHILNGDFKVSQAREMHLLNEFTLARDLYPYIAGRKWMLLRAPAGSSGFITSDRPVALMWQDALEDRPPGLGLKGTQLLFSVSSELMIVGTYEIDELVKDVDEETVAICNGQLIRWCDRQVYARDDGFTYKLRHFDGMRTGKDLPSDELCASANEA